MPRKRRRAKGRPLPKGLAEVSLCERSLWAVSGPLLETDGVTLLDGTHYRLWPDWRTWAEFYGSVREELYAARPWRRKGSAAERLYDAYLRGEDLDAVRINVDLDRRATDPRPLLQGGR